MRIIAGYLGGRTLKSPKSHKTHPMSDKVRGALFNMLGDVGGLSVLDAFAGSGALSFEAISRGVDKAVAVDSDKNAQQTIEDNIKSLGIGDRVKLIKANVSAWSDNNPGSVFDIVICDPPYDDVKGKLLAKIARHTRTNGIFVCSLPPGSEPDLAETGLKLLASKQYGDATLVFYRKTS